MHNYFVNMAKHIGPKKNITDIMPDDHFNDIIDEFVAHDSINFTKNNCPNNGSEFDFSLVSEECVLTALLKLKSTGHDAIPAKLLKYGAYSMCKPIQIIANRCISECTFPSNVNIAVATPVFKKNDNLENSNYIPASVLSSFVKMI